jgi:PAS domain S-box-containing protein
VAVVALLGILAAWRMSTIVAAHQRHDAETMFQVHALVTMEMLQLGIGNWIRPLTHMGKLLADEDTPISDTSFRKLAASMPLLHAPSILAMAYVPAVQRAERAAFEASAHQESPGFRILELTGEGRPAPARQRDEYFPLLYLHETQTSGLTRGLDLGSLPPLRQSMTMARDKNYMTMSPEVTLPLAPGLGSVVLIFHPVISAGGQRKGFVVGMFLLGVAAEKALTMHGGTDLDFEVVDVTDASQRQLLYHYSANPAKTAERPLQGTALHTSQHIHIAGRTWEIVATALPGTLPVNLQPAYFTLAGGLLMTALLTLYLIAQFRHTVRQEEFAEAQRRSRELLQAVHSAMAEGLLMVDNDQRVQLMNAEAGRLLGLAADQAQGRPIHELFHLYTLDERALVPNGSCITATQASGKVVRQEYWVERLDGNGFAAACISAPLRSNAALIGTVTTLRDVTEEKAAQRLRDEIIARVSHELRTPLAGIQGAAELLLGKELDARRQREMLRLIHENSVLLSELLADFLDLRRINGGGAELKTAPLALLPVIEQAIARNQPADGRHPMHCEAAAALPQVRADADALGRLLDALLDNAVKFSPAGGSITVSAAPTSDSEFVELCIADEGIGIPAAALPHIFTPLFQVEATDTRRFGGAGLGLALAKGIVAAHGGQIHAASEPGRGSRFCFTLPLAK